MEAREYIEQEIRKHFSKHSISLPNKQELSRMVDAAINGNTAFRLIYDLDNSTNHAHFFLVEWERLEPSLVMFDKRSWSPPMLGTYTTVTHDGGKRWQWNEIETLVIDAAEIRRLKIQQLGI